MTNKNTTKDPLIAFEEGGRAAVLQYNLPTSSTYHGIRLVDLTIDADWFTEDSKKTPELSENVGPTFVLDPPSTSIALVDRFLERKDALIATGDADDQVQAAKWDELYAFALAERLAVMQGVNAARGALDKIIIKARDLSVIVEAGPLIEEAQHEAEAWMAGNLQNTDLWIDGYSEMMAGTMSPHDAAFKPLMFAKKQKLRRRKLVQMS